MRTALEIIAAVRLDATLDGRLRVVLSAAS
jgi:hypothetical protein